MTGLNSLGWRLAFGILAVTLFLALLFFYSRRVKPAFADNPPTDLWEQDRLPWPMGETGWGLYGGCYPMGCPTHQDNRSYGYDEEWAIDFNSLAPPTNDDNLLPLAAVNQSVVVYADWNDGFGRTVGLQESQASTVWRYSHLSEIEPGIAMGAQITRGEWIGRTGGSGVCGQPPSEADGCYAAHLHFTAYGGNPWTDPTNTRSKNWTAYSSHALSTFYLPDPGTQGNIPHGSSNAAVGYGPPSNQNSINYNYGTSYPAIKQAAINDSNGNYTGAAPASLDGSAGLGSFNNPCRQAATAWVYSCNGGFVQTFRYKGYNHGPQAAMQRNGQGAAFMVTGGIYKAYTFGYDDWVNNGLGYPTTARSYSDGKGGCGCYTQSFETGYVQQFDSCAVLVHPNGQSTATYGGMCDY